MKGMRMNEFSQNPSIQKWLQKQQSRSFESLGNALIKGSWLKYCWYRLRFFNMKLVFDQLVHLVEILFLFSFLSKESFTSIIIIKFLYYSLINYWWGHLEVMREKLRAKLREDRSYLFHKVYQPWFDTVYTISVIMLMTIPVLIMLANYYSVVTVPEACLIGIYTMSFCLQINLRTHHSAIYSRSRIYRSTLSLIGPHILKLVVMLAASRLIGVWAVIIAELMSSLLGAGFSYYYIKIKYKQFKLPYKPQLIKKMKGFRILFTKNLFIKSGFISGLAYALLNFDFFLFLMMQLKKDSAFAKDNLVFILLLFFPIIKASSSWSYLFYFDIKKMMTRPFYILLQRYTKNLALTAFFVATAYSGVIVSVLYFGYQFNTLMSLLLIIGFVFVRSFFTIQSIKLYSFNRYRRVIILNLVMFILLYISTIFSQTVGQFILYAIGVHAFVLLDYFFAPYYFFEDRKLHINKWEALRRIRESDKSSFLHIVTIDLKTADIKKSANRWFQQKLGREMVRRKIRADFSFRIDDNKFAWVSPENQTDQAYLFLRHSILNLEVFSNLNEVDVTKIIPRLNTSEDNSQIEVIKFGSRQNSLDFGNITGLVKRYLTDQTATKLSDDKVGAPLFNSELNLVSIAIAPTKKYQQLLNFVNNSNIKQVQND